MIIGELAGGIETSASFYTYQKTAFITLLQQKFHTTAATVGTRYLGKFKSYSQAMITPIWQQDESFYFL